MWLDSLSNCKGFEGAAAAGYEKSVKGPANLSALLLTLGGGRAGPASFPMEDLDPSGYSLLQEAFDFSEFDTEAVHGADALASEQVARQQAQMLAGAGSAVQQESPDEGLRNLRASLTGDSESSGHGAQQFLSHLGNSGHLEPSLLEDIFKTDTDAPQQYHQHQQQQQPAALATVSSGLAVHTAQQQQQPQQLVLQSQNSFQGTLGHQMPPAYPMQYLQLLPNLEASPSMAPLSRSPSLVSESPHSGGGGSSAFKPRLRWTDDLHDKFLEAIVDLGGYQEATPSGILKAMGVDRLELSHVKSHLQKYRSEKKRSMEKDDDDKDSKKKAKTDAGASGSKAKPPSGAAKPKPNREPSMGKSSPRRADPGARGKANLMELSQQQHQQQQQQQQQQMNSTDSSGRVLEAALRKQFELQQMLAEQLEAQKKLQSSLEQHTKYISCLMQDKYNSGSEADATFLTLDPSEISDAHLNPHHHHHLQ